MRRMILLSALAAAMLLGGALSVAALGLDVELKAGGGMAMGTTDDADKSGELRWALGAGLTADLFLLEAGPLALGVSAGAGYANLHYHGVWENYPSAPFTPVGTTTQTSDSAYNYLMLPAALVGRFATRGGRALTARAGGFAGYFLSGASDLSYDPANPAQGWIDGEVTLDDTNTELWMYGLTFSAAVDLMSIGRLTIVPSLQFDLGLTDTSLDLPYPPASKDTFWALTANVGIRYAVLR